MAAIAEQSAEGILPQSFAVVIQQRPSDMASGAVHLGIVELAALADTIEGDGPGYNDFASNASERCASRFVQMR